MIRRLNSQCAGFSTQLADLLAFESAQDPAVDQTVADILSAVQREGDAAVLRYTAQFDGVHAEQLITLRFSHERLQAALATLPTPQRDALHTAATRIRTYHEHQLTPSWQYTEADGTVLGQKITALDRVGLYVPGGKAAYPSSVLMNAIPAKVAGVAQMVMVTPTPRGEVNELVLAAAAVAGVDEVYAIGGAQAIGALAYGTETIHAVDKIVGPGNAYVAAAKRRVFGVVGIDMVAGPSEILIVADGTTDPAWLAMDLFSQAEHDEIAQAILLCPNPDYLDAVADAIETLLPTMSRAPVIRASLTNRGALIQVRDMTEACRLANQIAPEHLELSVADPDAYLPLLKHAGAIFIGAYTSEALGDYCAGPNHVLPTSRTARFSSPLGVYDFQKRSSLIRVSAQGAHTLGQIAVTLAKGEGLPAHAQSAAYRLHKEAS